MQNHTYTQRQIHGHAYIGTFKHRVRHSRNHVQRETHKKTNT